VHGYNFGVPAATQTEQRRSRVATILGSIDKPAPTPAGPVLFLLSGLPGAGKSTFARGLAARTGALVLESDRLRALLFCTPVHSQRESSLLFSAMRAAASELLRRGHAVIIDATNVGEADRQPFYRLARRQQVPLSVVLLEAPEPVIESRLALRSSAANGYAFADVAVYHRMKARVEPISRPHMRVDTSDSTAVERALTALMAAHGVEVGKGTRTN
jgi:hypothetical protein